MTDVYNISEDARWILNQRRAAVGAAVVDLDSNPDDAARAMQLGRITGTPPSVIYSDMDGFEREHRAGITARILRDNAPLRDWANHDPMATKVASDDWGQLDAVSNKLKNLGLDTRLNRIGGAAFGGFAENYSSAMEVSEPKFQEEYERATPYIRTLMGTGRQKM